MPSIIHDPKDLLDLTREELDEVLLRDYKNSGLLRELLRCTLGCLKHEKEINKQLRKREYSIDDRMKIFREKVNDAFVEFKCGSKE